MLYADIIVDISHENLDQTYQYAVPPQWEEKAVAGALVRIPFGRGSRLIRGYIVGISEKASYPIEKIKAIDAVEENGIPIEAQLIGLAYWIKDNYGGTMNDALKTVIPVKTTVRNKEKKYIHLKLLPEQAQVSLEEFERKHKTAMARLLRALLDHEILDYETVAGKLSISQSTLKALEEKGVIERSAKRIYRNPIEGKGTRTAGKTLNWEQREAAREIMGDYQKGERKVYLLHGITGSGKTEVYMEVIDWVIKKGQKVIMLIPEIALTFQTVMRFYQRFGERVSILHSRLSKGERYDQYLRAKNGEIDIMIGPRSALFTPFHQLGLIILDEEHEGSYKSESIPKYHARETAMERARVNGASVILGSATPSLESYQKALKGEYQLLSLKKRAGKSTLPKVSIIDLREELKQKNKSMFSRSLKEGMIKRLQKREQIMLFINRRGYAGFVSCRSCGHVMKCSHCDVSLTSHNNGMLLCHYCGYQEEKPKVCPVCGSPFIAAFGTGTQKVEELVKREFPGAKVLRMDTDTTQGKGGHEKILSAFSRKEADILVGTQMIVKGHDFPDVTLVGILAADLSLYANDYRAAEKTFQLLTQASGRAGRSEKPGEVVIQTYNPEHYSIRASAEQDYESFYKQEMLYRELASYPPAEHMLVLLAASQKEEKAEWAIQNINEIIKKSKWMDKIKSIGPAKASLSKLNDSYRRVLYLKSREYGTLKSIKDLLEGVMEREEGFCKVNVQFDFDPLNSY